METDSTEAVKDLLNTRLVVQGRVGIGLGGRRFGRVDTSLSMDTVKFLRLRVVGLEVIVTERPGRGNPSVVP